MATRTKTEFIIIHGAATPPNMDIGVKEIDEWHKERGFNGCGYNEVIRRNGVPEQGREENAIGAHAKGYNSISVGICLVGGVDERGQPQNNYTPEQLQTLRRLLRFYRALFPSAAIIGHNEINPHKACPCFDVKAWIRDEGLF